MKTVNQIDIEIKHFQIRLFEKKTKHAQLNQIDCLSAEGSNLREQISQIEGKIQSLNWVKDNGGLPVDSINKNALLDRFALEFDCKYKDCPENTSEKEWEERKLEGEGFLHAIILINEFK